MDGPSYAELSPADALYELAAFVYHHARDLPADLRRGLFLALETAWPRTQGDRKEAEHRAAMAWRAYIDNGRSIERVAEAFSVALDTARRWVRRVEVELDSARPREVPGSGTPNAGEEWRVDVVWGEGEDEPLDPVAPISYARWLARSPDELTRQLDDRAHAVRAGAQLPEVERHRS